MKKMRPKFDLGGDLKDAAIGSEAPIGCSLHERIALKAYAIYEKRGCRHGSDLADWLAAEREVLLQDEIH